MQNGSHQEAKPDLNLETLFAEEIKRELQEAREEQMNYLGVNDLGKQTTKAEDRNYSSHTIYGSLARRDYTLEISDELKRRYSELKRGKAGVGREELFLLKDHLDWNRVAYIALSIMLDYAGQYKLYKRLHSKEKKEAGLITNTELWLMVGKHIMIEANLRHIKKTLPRKYKQLKEEFFTQHAGFRQRITNTSREKSRVFPVTLSSSLLTLLDLNLMLTLLLIWLSSSDGLIGLLRSKFKLGAW